MPKMQLVKPEHSGSSGPGFPVILVCLAVAGSVALGFWGYKKYQAGAVAGGGQTTTVAAVSKTNNNPIARATAIFNRVLDRNKEGEQTAEAVQKPAPRAAAVAVIAKPRSKPALIPGMPRVQAIFYRTEGATALIDGKTVRAGEQIGAAKVIEIKKESVRMQLGAETHDVTLR